MDLDREAAGFALRLGREDPLDALFARAPLELALAAILSSPFENVLLNAGVPKA